MPSPLPLLGPLGVHLRGTNTFELFVGQIVAEHRLLEEECQRLRQSLSAQEDEVPLERDKAAAAAASHKQHQQREKADRDVSSESFVVVHQSSAAKRARVLRSSRTAMPNMLRSGSIPARDATPVTPKQIVEQAERRLTTYPVSRPSHPPDVGFNRSCTAPLPRRSDARRSVLGGQASNGHSSGNSNSHNHGHGNFANSNSSLLSGLWSVVPEAMRHPVDGWKGGSALLNKARKSLRMPGRIEKVQTVGQRVTSLDSSEEGLAKPGYEQMWGTSGRLRALCSDRLNVQRQQLQALLAELDPDRQDEWASEEVTPEACQLMLRSQGKEMQLEHIAFLLRTVAVGLAANYDDSDEDMVEAQAGIMLKRAMVDLTSMQELETILCPEHVQDFLTLRDVVLWDTTNKLLFCFSDSELSALTGPCSTCRNWIRKMRQIPFMTVLDFLGTLLVIFNTIVIGVSTDVNSQWSGWDWVSGAFAIAFFCELTAKMLHLGPSGFFGGPDWRWNWFDSGLLIIAMLDLILMAWAEAFDGGSLTIVRMVRLARLSRVARLARMPIFQELTYMLRGIVAGSRTLGWAFILMLTVSYVGGVLLTQTLGEGEDGKVDQFMQEHFSSVDRSMFTMFRCFTGDCTTYDGRPLSIAMRGRYGIWVIVAYSCLIMLVNFGLFNVIMSVFVQNTQRASRFNEVERRRIRSRERKYVAKKTQRLVHRVWELYQMRRGRRSRRSDLSQELVDMTISRLQFEDILKDQEVNDLLDDLGMEDTNRLTLFDLIDSDNNGKLRLTELVDGIIRLSRGATTSLGVVTMMMRSMNTRLVDLEGFLTYRQLQLYDTVMQGTFASSTLPLSGEDIPGEDHCAPLNVDSDFGYMSSPSEPATPKTPIQQPQPTRSPESAAFHSEEREAATKKMEVEEEKDADEEEKKEAKVEEHTALVLMGARRPARGPQARGMSPLSSQQVTFEVVDPAIDVPQVSEISREKASVLANTRFAL